MKSRIVAVFCSAVLGLGASCLPSGGNGDGGNDGSGSNNGTTSSCTPAESEPCQVFELVNIERSEQGLEPLKYNAALETAAQLHAEDMVENDYFSHTSQDGRSFSDRVEDAGYTGFPAGENIAAGQGSAEQVMNSWMNSDGHRRNILNDGSNEIGVGFYNNYWVQVFGVRR
ncbi:MAG: CAP domain-containing protein [Myxococcota bacterium]